MNPCACWGFGLGDGGRGPLGLGLVVITPEAVLRAFGAPLAYLN